MKPIKNLFKLVSKTLPAKKVAEGVENNQNLDLSDPNLSSFPFNYYLDSPKVNEEIASNLIAIRGWITSEYPIEHPVLQNAAGTYTQPLAIVSRPDVQADYAGQYVVGFQSYFSIFNLLLGDSWNIEFLINSKIHKFSVNFTVSKILLDELKNPTRFTQPFTYCIDSPTFNEEVNSRVIGFRGWIKSEHLIENPTLQNQAGTCIQPLQITKRPDVAAESPHHYVLGFKHYLSAIELLPDESDSWFIHFSIRGKKYNFLVPFSISRQVLEELKNNNLSEAPFTCKIESPNLDEKINSGGVFLRGWMTADFPIKELTLCNTGTWVEPLEILNRQDVEADYPHSYVVGFQHYLSTRNLLSDESWFLRFLINGEKHTFPLTFSISNTVLADLNIQNQEIKPFTYWLDSPALNEEVTATFLIIRGWVTATHPIEQPTLQNAGGTFIQPLAIETRPDLKAHSPYNYMLGFQHFLSIADFSPGDVWSIHFFVDNQACSFALPFKISPQAYEIFWKVKHQKLQTLRNILRCPICESEKLEDLESALRCCDCGEEFSKNRTSYNFLTKELIEYGKVKPTTNISSSGYDEICRQLIREFPDGLILDNGCGLRKYSPHANVINFEIVEYATTDVVGIGEKLPFQSNAFDAVFSFAVLEHVKNPFECAQEIIRVLKPGGTLYIQVPFLQPFHGYPDHYYNMTSSGLKNLFAEDLNIIECGVQDAGAPIWCLSWFLNSYIRGLPASIAQKFKNMKVSELIEHPTLYLAKDFVVQLSPAAQEELASVNYLVGKKIAPVNTVETDTGLGN